MTAPLAAGDASRAVALAGIMAIVSGAVCIVAGVARLGFVTELLSKPIRYGYMNGIALTVLVSQTPKLIGVRIEDAGPLRDIWSIGVELLGGRAELGGIRARRRDPRDNPVDQEFQGSPRRPVRDRRVDGHRSDFRFADARPCLGAGTASARAAFVLDPLDPVRGSDRRGLSADSRLRSCRSPTPASSRAHTPRGLASAVDPNQEMIGLGAANLAAGFFQGFPISSSSSRTPVAEAAGARTQLTGVVGAVAVSLLLLVAPRLLENLPNAALAAVVIASAIGLFEIAGLKRLYRIQRWEFWLSIVCFAGVAVFGAIPGIGLAVLLAVIEFLWDGWRPHSAVLGRAEGVRGFHDITRYPKARQLSGLLLFRWDAPLFFANAELFKERVLAAAAAAPAKVAWLVVAAEPVTSVDVTAADFLVELDDALRDMGTKLCFAELKDPVKDTLKRFGLFDTIGEGFFFATIGAAVDAYRATHKAEWIVGADDTGERP